MISLQALADRGLLICPHCSGRLEATASGWFCTTDGCRRATEAFDEVAGSPALVDFDHSVLDRDRLWARAGASVIRRPPLPALLRRLVEGENRVAPRQVARMVALLAAEHPTARPLILVIGGGVVGNGLTPLYDNADVDLVAFDIYASPLTQFIADAHRVPLADGSVDGVIVQAVLEHVLRPDAVAAEIGRVVRPGGLVYADTPFMQQVHEAAYDFTRFTDSGHRHLFRGFEQLDSGVVAGAGTALRWSLVHFVRALTRSRAAARMVGLAFFWLSSTDSLLDPAHSLDAASSVFFLGRKTDREISPAEAVEYYQGAG